MTRKLAQSIVDDIGIFSERKNIGAGKKDIVNDLQKNTTLDEKTELDFHQFNELLLLCVKTRVTEEFFNYFVQGSKTLRISELSKLIDRFKKHSMLRYGNFEFAVDKLIKCKSIDCELDNWIKNPNDIIKEFKSRPQPITAIQKIGRDQVRFLGYLTSGKSKEIEEVIKKGKFNTKVYLTSDYMDVYVATSMRKEDDFQNVFDLCTSVFSEIIIRELNLRYFDPTQSFHQNRVAKGLIEGLMLKRAKCTIYAAQENDSFGKDSELAATLAQGKPVIAFVPTYDPDDKKYLKDLDKLPLNLLLEKSDICKKFVLSSRWDIFSKITEEISDFLEEVDRQLKRGNKNIKCSEDQFKKSIRIKNNDFMQFVAILATAESEFFNNRAKILQTLHPLGFQINLESGVANGVLVARTYKQCAEILFDIMTNQLDFDIITPGKKRRGYPKDDLNYLLCEKKSKCAFRVVTTDEMLTNSFWNFYLEEGK